MSYLSVLGKRFATAGLQDVLIEAGTVAQGSINGVLSGHNYNRFVGEHLKYLFISDSPVYLPSSTLVHLSLTPGRYELTSSCLRH